MLRAMVQPRRALHKHVSWKRISILVSLVIIAAAVTVLTQVLATVDIDKVVNAIGRKRADQISLAVALISISYFSLGFYDLLALRAIGRRDIPYRVAALANFTSYPIAHAIGAVVVVCSAIRYRIYSAHGLGAVDVAKICFLTGLTFWLGNLTVLSLSILYEPEAASLINQLPAPVNRGLAAAMILAIAAYLVWVRNGTRLIGRNSWSVTLPGGGLTLLQIGLGVVDLGCAALAMYVLAPAGLEVGVAQVVVVFIAATLLGFASHAPGGIGVFDATMLVALGATGKEEWLAALLVFRLLYHVVPFMLALVLFGLRESWTALRNRGAP